MGKGYPIPPMGPLMPYDPLQIDMFVWLRPVLTIFLFLLTLYLLYMAFKAPSKFWEKFSHNLKVFYLYAAAFVGLIMFIVNGITLTKTFLETTVFPVEYDYVDYYQCENPRYDTPDGKARTLTGEEKKECEERMLKQAKENRMSQVNRQYASGLAGFLFGLILWVPHFMLARRLD